MATTGLLTPQSATEDQPELPPAAATARGCRAVEPASGRAGPVESIQQQPSQRRPPDASASGAAVAVRVHVQDVVAPIAAGRAVEHDPDLLAPGPQMERRRLRLWREVFGFFREGGLLLLQVGVAIVHALDTGDRVAQDALDSDEDDNASMGGDELVSRSMIDFPVPLEEI